ncbi:hypothetical protein PD716_15295 [Vibrio gigantis]|uniref:hypothetical protein n=1 Tax=Vibrio gigantis TaxID=296199 RepID=UPI001BFDBB2A|nr:hypothetical protein [Vibrio gigantis]
MKTEVKITKADFAIGEDGKGHIASPSLLNALVKTNPQTLDLLEQLVSPISVDDIEIDEFGRVVVENQVFVSNLAAAISNDVVSDTCGNNCNC